MRSSEMKAAEMKDAEAKAAESPAGSPSKKLKTTEAQRAFSEAAYKRKVDRDVEEEQAAEHEKSGQPQGCGQQESPSGAPVRRTR